MRHDKLTAESRLRGFLVDQLILLPSTHESQWLNGDPMGRQLQLE